VSNILAWDCATDARSARDNAGGALNQADINRIKTAARETISHGNRICVLIILEDVVDDASIAEQSGILS
jgi:hypothetical protein